MDLLDGSVLDWEKGEGEGCVSIRDEIGGLRVIKQAFDEPALCTSKGRSKI